MRPQMHQELITLVGDDDGLVSSISVTVALLLLCMLLGHLLHTNKWVNESITSLIVIPGQEEELF